MTGCDRLRCLVAATLDDLTAEILAANEKMAATDAPTSPTSNTGDGQGKGASAEGKRKLEYRAELRRKLTGRFNRDELRTLCFDLGIEHENLPETKNGMARESYLPAVNGMAVSLHY